MNILYFPATKNTLCQFVTMLAQNGPKFCSIKCYHAAVNFAHIAHGFGNACCSITTVCCGHVLVEIKRSLARINPQPTTQASNHHWYPQAPKTSLVLCSDQTQPHHALGSSKHLLQPTGLSTVKCTCTVWHNSDSYTIHLLITASAGGKSTQTEVWSNQSIYVLMPQWG